jgi:hypothetical protein
MLTESQLHAALTAEQIAAIEANRPSWDSAVPSPVLEEITAATAKVEAYAAGWEPAAALLTSWARAIAAWELCKRLGIQNEGQKEARDRALKELEDLRSGLFAGIPRASGGRVAHGSRENILTP